MFLTEKQARNLSPATVRNYRKTMELFFKFQEYDDEIDVGIITKQDVYKWMNTLKLDGNKPTSINHYLRDLRAFLYWCMEDSRAYIKPAYKVELIEGQEEQLKLFTDEELDAMLEKPTKRDGFTEWRTWAIVNWVLATGNRAATICNVKLTDVSFGEKEIALRHTKNKKAQILPLSPSLETALKEYIRMWRKEAPIDGYMFPNVGEEQLTTNALRLSFGRYCKARGVDKSNIHGLRHNFAKGWVKNNGNMFVLQKILGHSTLDMTRRYVKLFADDVKTDYEKFSPLDTMKRKSKRTKMVQKG